MLTIIASFVGFLGSIMPDIFKLFADGKDKAHELKIMSLQIEMQKQKRHDNNVTRLEEIRAVESARETKFISRTYFSGNKVIDAINASVRPILAYSFFMLYVASKILQFIIIDGQGLTIGEIFEAYLPVIWSEDDQAIFAGIISFYYGQRSMLKSGAR